MLKKFHYRFFLIFQAFSHLFQPFSIQIQLIYKIILRYITVYIRTQYRTFDALFRFLFFYKNIMLIIQTLEKVKRIYWHYIFIKNLKTKYRDRLSILRLNIDSNMAQNNFI